MDILSIVIPSYNEEEMLPITIPELRKLLQKMIDAKKISPDSFMLFVNDGSKDKTWEILEDEHKKNKDVYAIKLARNAGHQNALLAGLTVAESISDIAVSVDCDLQDDLRAIEKMIKEL